MRQSTTPKQKILLVTLGLFLTFVMVEGGMRITGWAISTVQQQRNIQKARARGTYRILCLGESTTAMGGDQSYPAQLEKILNARNVGIKFTVFNAGKIATTTSRILSELENNLDHFVPDMVITMMGINDDRHDVVQNRQSRTSRLTSLLNGLKVYKLFNHFWLHSSARYKDFLESDEVDGEGGNTDDVPMSVELSDTLEEAGQWLDDLQFGKAEQLLLKVQKIDSANMAVQAMWGDLHFQKKEYTKAEKYLARAVELDPDLKYQVTIDACRQLIRVYLSQKKYVIIEQLFVQAQHLLIKDAELLRLQANFYRDKGKHARADTLLDQAEVLEFRQIGKLTIDNYRALKETVIAKGLKLVCVQYPLRNTRNLMNTFHSLDGIVFVDNNRIFKNELKSRPYSELFSDYFAGDFGHTTPYGNKVLAENIADVIIGEVF